MLVKIHKSYRDIVAICDSELLGKKFEQGNLQLDLTGEFFKGDEKSEKEVFEIMKDASTEDASFNIIGKQATQLALKSGIISKEGIKKVQGVPFALNLL
ncbi:MAG: DUF424 domain-containing protein [Nanoarchaeota archaeon]|nr:DUF424 domain-containing protein [Nanoarchaeota archaeon]